MWLGPVYGKCSMDAVGICAGFLRFLDFNPDTPRGFMIHFD